VRLKSPVQPGRWRRLLVPLLFLIVALELLVLAARLYYG